MKIQCLDEAAAAAAVATSGGIDAQVGALTVAADAIDLLLIQSHWTKHAVPLQ